MIVPGNLSIRVVDEEWEPRPCRKCADRKAILESNETWRRQCGCIRTSDKLRKIIECFPAPPPPSPANEIRNPDPSTKSVAELHNAATCISAFCTVHQSTFSGNEEECKSDDPIAPLTQTIEKETEPLNRRSWTVVSELVQLLQLSVTATALALYYLIYCYMQLVYYTLRSALYFHNADGPMKVTIGVVTLTSLIVGFNLLLRMERLIFIFH
ncbi:unnamed protein product, partial [Iphiclides podalirius]